MKNYRNTAASQWDGVFPDGDIFKKGVGGQGFYSPARDVVMAYFRTGNGNGQENGGSP